MSYINAVLAVLAALTGVFQDLQRTLSRPYGDDDHHHRVVSGIAAAKSILHNLSNLVDHLEVDYQCDRIHHGRRGGGGRRGRRGGRGGRGGGARGGGGHRGWSSWE